LHTKGGIKMIILPYNLKPILCAYQPEAFLCGILFSKNEKYLPYLLSHYIQFIYYEDYATYRTRLNYNNFYENWLFKNHGLISFNCLSIPYFITESERIDFVKIVSDVLHDGYYIMGIYNEYFIPGKSAYNSHHFDHDYLIYGVDEEKQEFYSAGYLQDGFYSTFTIPFDNYNKSLHTTNRPYHIFWFLKFNNDLELSFNINTVKQGLWNYLNSYKPDNSKNTYGLQAIESLITLFEEMKNKQNDVDLRSLFALKEHKQLMRIRLNYMMEKNHIKRDEHILVEYDQMIQQSEMALSLGMKYNITKNQSTVDKICGILHENMKMEIDCLKNIYDQITYSS